MIELLSLLLTPPLVKDSNMLSSFKTSAIDDLYFGLFDQVIY
jgi:hypothetical protein